VKLFVHELRNQQRLFWRNRELAFFTFMLPLILYVMLGSVQQDEQIEGVRGSEYLLAGMIGYGAAAIGFGALAMSLVYRREDGTLKRLRATPLPASTYIAALLTSILISFAITTLILFALGALLFDVGVPHRIGSVAALVVLGALAFAALGLAGAALVRSDSAAVAVLNGIYLPMTFLSGSYFSSEAFPEFLQRIGDLLPLTYYIDVARDVMLQNEPLWEHPGALLVVAAWGAAGALVALRRFSWVPLSREGVTSGPRNEPLMAFATGENEIRINFGVFAGRDATSAEIEELARALHERIQRFTIVAEHRFEFGDDVEASVHLVRLCPEGAIDDELRGRLLEICERWADSCVAERQIEVAEL
jgi:ABC-2 type transport system permease protein